MEVGRVRPKLRHAACRLSLGDQFKVVEGAVVPVAVLEDDAHALGRQRAGVLLPNDVMLSHPDRLAGVVERLDHDVGELAAAADLSTDRGRRSAPVVLAAEPEFNRFVNDGLAAAAGAFHDCVYIAMRVQLADNVQLLSGPSRLGNLAHWRRVFRWNFEAATQDFPDGLNARTEAFGRMHARAVLLQLGFRSTLTKMSSKGPTNNRKRHRV